MLLLLFFSPIYEPFNVFSEVGNTMCCRCLRADLLFVLLLLKTGPFKHNELLGQNSQLNLEKTEKKSLS